MTGHPVGGRSLVEEEGGTLRVGRWGSGPPVVLGAHGLTATHLHFHPLADQLGDGFPVVAPAPSPAPLRIL